MDATCSSKDDCAGDQVCVQSYCVAAPDVMPDPEDMSSADVAPDAAVIDAAPDGPPPDGPLDGATPDALAADGATPDGPLPDGPLADSAVDGAAPDLGVDAEPDAEPDGEPDAELDQALPDVEIDPDLGPDMAPDIPDVAPPDQGFLDPEITLVVDSIVPADQRISAISIDPDRNQYSFTWSANVPLLSYAIHPGLCGNTDPFQLGEQLEFQAGEGEPLPANTPVTSVIAVEAAPEAPGHVETTDVRVCITYRDALGLEAQDARGWGENRIIRDERRPFPPILLVEPNPASRTPRMRANYEQGEDANRTRAIQLFDAPGCPPGGSILEVPSGGSPGQEISTPFDAPEVEPNSTTNYSARLVSRIGNPSGCSQPAVFEHNEPPWAPALHVACLQRTPVSIGLVYADNDPGASGRFVVEECESLEPDGERLVGTCPANACVAEYEALDALSTRPGTVVVSPQNVPPPAVRYAPFQIPLPFEAKDVIGLTLNGQPALAVLMEDRLVFVEQQGLSLRETRFVDGLRFRANHRLLAGQFSDTLDLAVLDTDTGRAVFLFNGANRNWDGATAVNPRLGPERVAEAAVVPGDAPEGVVMIGEDDAVLYWLRDPAAPNPQRVEIPLPGTPTALDVVPTEAEPIVRVTLRGSTETVVEVTLVEDTPTRSWNLGLDNPTGISSGLSSRVAIADGTDPRIIVAALEDDGPGERVDMIPLPQAARTLVAGVVATDQPGLLAAIDAPPQIVLSTAMEEGFSAPQQVPTAAFTRLRLEQLNFDGVGDIIAATQDPPGLTAWISLSPDRDAIRWERHQRASDAAIAAVEIGRIGADPWADLVVLHAHIDNQSFLYVQNANPANIAAGWNTPQTPVAPLGVPLDTKLALIDDDNPRTAKWLVLTRTTLHAFEQRTGDDVIEALTPFEFEDGVVPLLLAPANGRAGNSVFLAIENGLVQLQWNGNRFVQAPGFAFDFADLSALEACDVDGDGTPEFFAAFGQAVHLLEIDGGGLDSRLLIQDGFAGHFTCHDMDADGVDEAVVATEAGLLVFPDVDSEPFVVPEATPPVELIVADTDADLRPDVVTVEGGMLRVYRGDPLRPGALLAPVALPLPNDVMPVKLGRGYVNGPFGDEIILVSQDGGVATYWVGMFVAR